MDSTFFCEHEPSKLDDAAQAQDGRRHMSAYQGHARTDLGE